MAKKIRFRWGSGHTGEYQVVEGRKVVGRYDLLEQAKRAHPDAVQDKSCE